MWFFRISLGLVLLIWVYSITMWQIPELTRQELDLYHYYILTFFELPIICLALGISMIFLHRHCTSPRVFKAAMIGSWGYVLFPVATSFFLIAATYLGITGY